MKNTPFALLTCVALIGGLLGCNRQTATAPAKSGSSPAMAGGELKVVYIPKSSGNPYFTEVVTGFEEACRELKCEFTTIAPSTADATSQIPIIKEQIQRGVNVLAISANSPNALNQVLDEARSRGITVITVDSDLVDNESHRDACVIPTDFSAIGKSQVELLAKLTGGKGEFAILSATTDAPNQNAWIAKMKETLTDPKYKDMKLVATVYGDDDPQKSTTECEALLAKYPKLSGIISPTSVGLAASAQVVERTGVYPGGKSAVGSGLHLTGLSTPDQLRKFVEKGVVTSFQLWSPKDEGILAAHLGIMINQKKLTPKASESFEIPGLGSRKFSDKLEVTAGDLLTFDKANIGQYKF